MNSHRQLEDMSAEWSEAHTDTRIYCGAGCANCCRLAVHASYPEAAYVAERLERSLDDPLEAYVTRLLAESVDLETLSAYLRCHGEALGSCPFLGQGQECLIYADRPLTCRALLATRPANWCGLDLATLDDWDKRLFQESLDCSVVDWPTHYVAATRQQGLAMEQSLCASMRDETGWSLSGNFPLLVWLERTHRLRNHCRDAVLEILNQLKLLNSPLLDLTAGLLQSKER